MKHYANLELPLEAHEYLARLNDHLKKVTNDVDRRVPANKALTIDPEKAEATMTGCLAAVRHRNPLFSRRFADDVVTWCVRWYPGSSSAIDVAEIAYAGL